MSFQKFFCVKKTFVLLLFLNYSLNNNGWLLAPFKIVFSERQSRWAQIKNFLYGYAHCFLDNNQSYEEAILHRTFRDLHSPLKKTFCIPFFPYKDALHPHCNTFWRFYEAFYLKRSNLKIFVRRVSLFNFLLFCFSSFYNIFLHLFFCLLVIFFNFFF